MRAALITFLLCAACGKSPTSQAGPVGATEDLRGHLPPDVAARAPSDAQATKFEYATDVHGVKAKLIWHGWTDGEHKYLLSTRWEVITPKDGVMLEPLPSMNPRNAGTPAAVIEAVPTRLRWHQDSTFSTTYGELTFNIDAAGTAAPI